MDFNRIYTELDALTGRASETTGQRCAPGCGQCCRRPSKDIETSVAEMRPLARVLWESGEAQTVWDRAVEAGSEGWCVLYEPDSGEGPYARGRCGRYGHRPLTCRLFGWAAVKDKSGVPRGTFSTVMKTLDPGLADRFDRAVAGGYKPPVAAEWRTRMAEVSMSAAVDLVSLNEALAGALELEGLAWRFKNPGPGPKVPR